ncbi:leucine Rich Repeat domain containing protein [Coccidioides immitis RMSCC 2394]|uniref:Leucine Rich Repeat domain containing protein n=1 Tax=Coccidioides immitis RMSCC 2394 TaxID=404692 RepID=A0A0J6Y8U9_COCIT|nr:leucine Rich Repeat domain containing protein [Coccidioides immitis RMSCC 2394]
MEKLNTEDGQLFIKNLARFVRTHEKALANALQMRRQTSKSLDSSISPPITGRHGSSSRSATSSSLAAVFSLGSLSFTSHNIKPAKLTLTPHHVFYLLSRFEELSVPVGPMNIRLENINTEASSAYVSFLNKPRRPKGDRDSIHSVSSVRSVLSGMSVFWSSFGLGSKDSVSKSRQGQGSDRKTLTLKRASVDDVGDLLTGIVLDDIDKRRRRSTRNPQSPVSGGTTASPVTQPEPVRASSAPGSPVSDHNFGNRSSPKCGSAMVRAGSAEGLKQRREGSASPPRPPSSRRRHIRGASTKIKRSGSGSSNSSECSTVYRHRSMSNLLAAGILPSTKWRFLRHLGLPDNSMTSITAISLAPVANTLHSLDLSWNLFTEVPDSLSTLVALRSLNLSHCMIGSLHSLSRNPLPAITALNLRANRLRSIAGVERLLSLERLDLRENNIPDPTEMARLTSIPYLREIWVAGNPFTKSHSDYRVTIFNLFRRTPGFSEDILIDGSGPTYSERKKLVERVAEPESAPVIRPNEQANSREDDVLIAEPVITQCAQPKALEEKATNPASIRKQEHAVGSTRRKKPHRRRIVDLSQDESRDTLASEIVEPTTPKSESPFQERQDTLTRPALPRLNTGSDSVSPVLSKVAGAGSAAHFLPAIEGVDWDSSGDIYRQRLEALKQEVGTNWLTVLDDETWGGKQRDIGFPSSDGSGLHPVGPIHPHRMTGATGHAIASSGRTLG